MKRNRKPNKQTYIRGLQFAAPLHEASTSDTEFRELYMPLEDPKLEALRLHLFPFVKAEAIRILQALPHLFHFRKERLEEIKAATTYEELPFLETTNQGCGLVRYVRPYTWEFARQTIGMYVQHLDWTLVFPNDVARLEDGNYAIMPRCRKTNSQKGKCSFADGEIGSVWTRDYQSFITVSEHRDFPVVSEPFEPAKVGIYTHFYRSDDYYDYRIYEAESDIVLAQQPVMVDVAKTMAFLESGRLPLASYSQSEPNDFSHYYSWFNSQFNNIIR